MGKKTSSKIIAIRSPKYRWEFLRRDEKYIKFYKKLKDSRRFAGYDKDFEEQVSYIGWGLSGPADPNKTYEENLKLLKKEIFLPSAVVFKPDSSKLSPILEGRFAIYLNFPKRTILNGLEKKLAPYFKKYRKSLGKMRKSRVRLEAYDRYLGIFDLWGKLDIKELAKKFYPGVVKDGNLDYAKMQVRRDYKRCKEMIGGDYQHLR